MATPKSTDCERIRGIIVRILTSDKKPAKQRKEISTHVCNALRTRGRFYFHAEIRDFETAMFFDGTRRTLVRIRSDEFKAWLSEWIGVNRADFLFAHITAAIET